MSVQYASNLSTTRLPVPSVDPWVRPAEWMALPTIPAGTQRVNMLVAVFPNGTNYFSVTISGAYRIDWGDGAGFVNYTSGSRADRVLNFSDYASDPLTAEGWRQAIVTIEPQSGQNLTSLNLNVRHGSAGTAYSTGLLDMQISGPQLTTLTMGAASPTTFQYWLQRVGIQGTTAISSIAFRAANTALVRFEGTDWAGPSLTSLAGAFVSCSALREIDLFNTATVTSWAECFSGCSSLREVPAFNTSSATGMNTMFRGCVNLRTVPLFNTANCTNFSEMFRDCSVLQSVPLLNTASATNTTGMFLNCSALQSVPLLNLSAVTNVTQMFDGTSSMFTVPALNLQSVTTGTSMFLNSGLTGSYTFNLANATTVSNMFRSTRPRELTLNNMGNVTTGGTDMFSSVVTLTSLLLNGMRASVNVSNNQLDATALNALYTSLGTALPGATITVTGNPGTTGDNPAIATAKGWTVTGS